MRRTVSQKYNYADRSAMNQIPGDTSRVETQIAYRPALREESRAIADLICEAGGGLYEFLLDDFVPFMTARDIISWGVEMTASPFSHENCWVAASPSEIVGVVNIFQPIWSVRKIAFPKDPIVST